MGDDHVAIGAGRLVEVAALGQSEGLGHVDLDVVDVIAVPDRLEQSVGEAEGEDVLGRLLAEEMVDAEDLILIERLVQLLVERDGTGQIRAEGLLHDDSAALDQARLADHVDCGEGRLGRDGEVVQPQLVGAGQHVLRAAHPPPAAPRDRRRSGRSRGAGRRRADPRRRAPCASRTRGWPRVQDRGRRRVSSRPRTCRRCAGRRAGWT